MFALRTGAWGADFTAESVWSSARSNSSAKHRSATQMAEMPVFTYCLEAQLVTLLKRLCLEIMITEIQSIN